MKLLIFWRFINRIEGARLYRIFLLIVISLATAFISGYFKQKFLSDPIRIEDLLTYRLPKDGGSQNLDPKNNEMKRFAYHLFRDAKFFSSNTMACISCHNPDLAFASIERNSNIEGFDYIERDVLPLFNLDEQSWFFWDGSSDRLEGAVLLHSQMLAPSKHSPLSIVRLIDQNYKDTYAKIWGAFPAELSSWLRDKGANIEHASYRKLALQVPEGFISLWESYRDGFAETNAQLQGAFDAIESEIVRRQIRDVYENVGLALAAYLRAIRLEPSAFDRFIDRAQSGG